MNDTSTLSFIYNHIYIGSVSDANDYQLLTDNGITHVLGLIGYQEKFQRLRYLVFSDVNDEPSENIIRCFNDSFKFIDECLQSGGKILVHCHAGISRSSTIVIAYLMYKYNMNYETAFRIVKRGRNIINPNYGFVLQLKVFEKYDKTIRI